ncbi:D-site 20S pre-rRNA nuclease [Rhizodiscina lignyota]|uniref:20S-pre-rRNA D-site endonuclease NOB1 n=1 Tax=Rhizodiscina lignyota TaxID=1504668 RepID=A0A9P4ID83_9PEZI|nr:D-site 20S pre-rRNA nuclease [Rhizodiscina lignyota]
MEKPVHTIVLDAGPIIKNEPTVSSLLLKAEKLVTTPAVITEIKDEATRSRVETTLIPFLELRNPRPESIQFVQDFARRTGDLAVLSRPDIQILALAYELECERNRGDWRLRKVPGQKRTNGPPPATLEAQEQELASGEQQETTAVSETSTELVHTSAPTAESNKPQDNQSSADARLNAEQEQGLDVERLQKDVSQIDIAKEEQDISEAPAPIVKNEVSAPSHEASESSDSEGWITPSNIKRHQTKESTLDTSQQSEPKTMQVATMTTDFAMQNVLLQINLNLLSPSFLRVKHLKTFVLRCHACFQTTKDMTKQFCPRCGQPALTRVACSTNSNGEFKLHLKRNMQWNTRGDRYSVPKPVSGAANGRVQGGGKGGWGNDLILAEDQKEYVRAMAQEKRQKQRDLMDEDFLPSIVSGKRSEGREGGRLRIGGGRNVNSKKR